MRALCYDFRLSVLGGVAIGLLAFAVPAAATVTSGATGPATSLDDAWRACNAPQLSSADRIAYCTTIIESGQAKPAAHEFCGEEGIEHPRLGLLVHAAAIIPDAEHDLLFGVGFAPRGLDPHHAGGFA